MKIIVIFAICCCITSSAFAQNEDTLKSPCEYDIFPIGAIHDAPGDTLERMFGMNFCWDRWRNNNQPKKFPQQAGASHNSTTFRDPFCYPETLVHYADAGEGIYGRFFNALGGKDVRIFMPGTCPVTQEYNYSWNTKLGGLDNIENRPTEWKIDTIGIHAGDYILSDLGGAGSDPYYDQDSIHLGSYSYELVYLFDSVQLSQIISDTQPLYSIEYWIKKSKDNAFQFYLADTITKKTYQVLPNANTQVFGRNVGAEKLDSWAGVPVNVGYVIQKDILRIDTFFINRSPINPPQVDVRLRTFHQLPIFIRCLRIRDWTAQQLLNAKADSVLNKVIQAVLQTGDNKYIKSWELGNEPYYPNFHSYSYFNDLLQKNQAPPISVLTPWSHDEFIRIERDQSENPPLIKRMFLWHEWVPYTGMFWYVNYGTHYDWDYGNFPIRPLLPATFMLSSADSSDWYAHAIFLESNYSTYTNHWQNVIIGFSSELIGGGSGYMSNLISIAKACYETDPKNPIPYYGCYSAMASPIHGAPLWVLDSEKYVNSYSSATADSIWKYRYADPYINRHLGEELEVDSLYHLYWDWRPSTIAEIRSQFWTGVCVGLKGYLANAAIEDIHANDGFLWNDSPNHYIKSYDRTEMRLDYFLDTSGFLRYPYSRKIYNTTQYKLKSRLLPAFTGMYNGVKTTIQDELAPIATGLAKLNWIGSVSWHKKDSSPVYLSRLPIKDLHAMNNGLTDPDSLTYIQCGIFKDSVDSGAVYVSILNRRLWTDPKDTLTTDSRTITFQVDSSKFNSIHQSTEWKIIDVAAKLHDTNLTTGQTYSFIVKAGQGKLFKIVPIQSLSTRIMPKESNNISVYITPNPFDKQTHISMIANKDIMLDVRVCDILGKEVKTLHSGIAASDHYDFIISRNDVQHDGVYMLRIQNGSEVVTRTIELIK